MTMSMERWTKVSESQYPWEREALEYVRAGLPDHDPYRAWSNFEFIADDGSINEVDLLVITPMGFFIVEIKSRPGELRAEPDAWSWRTTNASGKSRAFTEDSPLLLCNRKAKRLKSLLDRQRSTFKTHGCPFLEPLVFLSSADLKVNFHGNGRSHIALRDTDKGDGPGIIGGLKRRAIPGLKQDVRKVSKPQAKAVARALEKIGIRPSQASRRVGDYRLKDLLYESPRDSYQDFRAEHVSDQVKGQYRVRIYNVAPNSSAEDKAHLSKAARREFEICQLLNHDAIVPVQTMTEHELGPALVFSHDPDAVRFDHYLRQHADTLTIEHKLSLIRQIAEALKYAHGKHIVHRALSPQSITVRDVAGEPQLQIFNWMAGDYDHTTSAHTQTCSLHPDQLVDDESMVYLSPEAVHDPSSRGRHFDVFSLGAIIYHIMSGQPPAANFHDLLRKLEERGSLDISEVSDTAPEQLNELIQFCTSQKVQDRYDSVDEILVQLDEYVDKLTTPDDEYDGNPLDAKPGDRLRGGYAVKRRLGKGSTAVVFLVEKGGQEQVLKLANKSANNSRIEGEFKCLKSDELQHELIVDAYDLVNIDGLSGFTMKQAGKHTLAEELRQVGRLQLEMLQRYGRDLLDLLVHLENCGVAHRDIKPDNIGIGSVTAKSQYRLQLFDFSLNDVSIENTLAGTPPYRDPFMSSKGRGRWDSAAERFAVAMTLYEMATGNQAKWEGGPSSGSEATIDAESFESSLRKPLSVFFEKALKNDARKRYDNAIMMRQAWNEVFLSLDVRPTTTTTTTTNGYTELGGADLDTALHDMDMSPMARSAFEKLNLITVRDLLSTSVYKVRRIRGTGLKTQKEILALYDKLRERFPSIDVTPDSDASAPAGAETLDMLVSTLENIGASKKQKHDLLHRLFGLKDTEDLSSWPGLQELSRVRSVPIAKLHDYVNSAQSSIRNEKAFTALRRTIAGILEHQPVIAVEELASAVLAARGSVMQGDQRRRSALAVTRAAVEAERSLEQPAFTDLRVDDRAYIAVDDRYAPYIQALGLEADDLADMDPLASAQQAVQRLRAVPRPSDATAIDKDRDLVRLACHASQNAAASPGLEIYPRQMDARRTLNLAQGAISGVPQLTVEDIVARVSTRYPEAQALPSRPTLDSWLAQIGLELTFSEDLQAYIYPRRNTFTYSSSSLTSFGSYHAESTDTREARRFHKRLEAEAKQGGYLVLTCEPKYLQMADAALVDQLQLDRVDVDALFIRIIRQVAEEQEVPDWRIVLEADAAPHDSEDWQIFQDLIRSHAAPRLEAELGQSPGTRLLVNAGLLARYEQMAIIGRLRDRALKHDGIHGLWLLVAAHGQNPWPVLNGEAVPVLGTSQYDEIPRAWLAGAHLQPAGAAHGD